MSSETKDIAIGAVAFGCLALVFAYVYSGRTWKESAGAGSVFISGKFNRVDGLIEGDDVRLGGIKIGSIHSMKLDPQYRAKVTMKISNDVKLPLDTSAAIHTDGLFGTKFMVLEPGGEEDFIKGGGEINYTQDSVVVSDLLDLIIAEGRAAMKKLQQLDQKQETK